MYIHEAIKMALKQERRVTVRGLEKAISIKPTNSSMGCICELADGNQKVVPRWQPTADDLMRDDYEVI